MRITTVARNARPTPRAASLKRFLSIIILAEYCGNEWRSSEVTRSIIAVTASHRLMSDSVKGKLIHFTFVR
jgi:hypothetical protein